MQYAKEYTPEEIAALEANEHVAKATRYSVVLQDSFVHQLHDTWNAGGRTPEVITAGLHEASLDGILSSNYADVMNDGFCHRLRAHNTDNHKVGFTGQLAVTASGITEWYGADRVAFTREFISEYISHAITMTVPSQASRDIFIDMGLESESHLIAKSSLERLNRLVPDRSADSRTAAATPNGANPFVEKANPRSAVMTDAFYDLASLFTETKTKDLLQIFEVDISQMGHSGLWNIEQKRREWHYTGSADIAPTPQAIRIVKNLLKLQIREIQDNFTAIASLVPKMTCLQKKALCRQLSEYPSTDDYAAGLSRAEIIDAAGVKHTAYYKALRKANYGLYEERKKVQDEEDLKALMIVVGYKDFEKGLRQIYMMLPDLTGRHMALSKIRRLLRSAGIRTKIREPNPWHQSRQKFLEENVKPNLLQRKFRLHRPGEVRQSDVTYLNYGPNESLRAYASSCIDPVTGVLLVLNISSSNDLQLALDTLDKLSDHPSAEDALFHTDQGILYLSPVFQGKVAEMGMQQSMSKRGNCWDNAVAESFFSVFKTEVAYWKCQTYEELEALVNRYADYYNHDRHQWDRMKMTPVQFDKYLRSLSDEEFQKYLDQEQEKYDRMKKHAESLAQQRNKTLGV